MDDSLGGMNSTTQHYFFACEEAEEALEVENAELKKQLAEKERLCGVFKEAVTECTARATKAEIEAQSFSEQFSIMQRTILNLKRRVAELESGGVDCLVTLPRPPLTTPFAPLSSPVKQGGGGKKPRGNDKTRAIELDDADQIKIRPSGKEVSPGHPDRFTRGFYIPDSWDVFKGGTSKFTCVNVSLGLSFPTRSACIEHILKHSHRELYCVLLDLGDDKRKTNPWSPPLPDTWKVWIGAGHDKLIRLPPDAFFCENEKLGVSFFTKSECRDYIRNKLPKEWKAMNKVASETGTVNASSKYESWNGRTHAIKVSPEVYGLSDKMVVMQSTDNSGRLIHFVITDMNVEFSSLKSAYRYLGIDDKSPESTKSSLVQTSPTTNTSTSTSTTTTSAPASVSTSTPVPPGDPRRLASGFYIPHTWDITQTGKDTFICANSSLGVSLPSRTSCLDYMRKHTPRELYTVLLLLEDEGRKVHPTNPPLPATWKVWMSPGVNMTSNKQQTQQHHFFVENVKLGVSFVGKPACRDYIRDNLRDQWAAMTKIAAETGTINASSKYDSWSYRRGAIRAHPEEYGFPANTVVMKSMMPNRVHHFVVVEDGSEFSNLKLAYEYLSCEDIRPKEKRGPKLSSIQTSTSNSLAHQRVDAHLQVSTASHKPRPQTPESGWFTSQPSNSEQQSPIRAAAASASSSNRLLIQEASQFDEDGHVLGGEMGRAFYELSGVELSQSNVNPASVGPINHTLFK